MQTLLSRHIINFTCVFIKLLTWYSKTTVSPQTSTTPSTKIDANQSTSIIDINLHVDLPLRNPTSSHSMTTRSKMGIFKKKIFSCYSQRDLDVTELHTVREALTCGSWKHAMEDEIHALSQKSTWILVPPIPNMNFIGSRWVFQLKQNPDGLTNHYKAHLVAKDFHQTPKIDFKKTFSQVIKPATIRLALYFAITHKWSIRHVDINNAFLNGKPTEDVFMT